MGAGKIVCEEAYAQGKMLNHESWLLPRGITPSDIDAVFDDGLHGRTLFVELTKSTSTWSAVSAGQRRLYWAIVARGHGNAIASLCLHAVPSHLEIDTRNDIVKFQVMYFASLFGCATSPVYEGKLWPRFVDDFYNGKQFSFPNEP